MIRIAQPANRLEARYIHGQKAVIQIYHLTRSSRGADVIHT